jgi:hypothetical protein
MKIRTIKYSWDTLTEAKECYESTLKRMMKWTDKYSNFVFSIELKSNRKKHFVIVNIEKGNASKENQGVDSEVSN